MSKKFEGNMSRKRENALEYRRTKIKSLKILMSVLFMIVSMSLVPRFSYGVPVAPVGFAAKVCTVFYYQFDKRILTIPFSISPTCWGYLMTQPLDKSELFPGHDLSGKAGFAQILYRGDEWRHGFYVNSDFPLSRFVVILIFVVIILLSILLYNIWRRKKSKKVV